MLATITLSSAYPLSYPLSAVCGRPCYLLLTTCYLLSAARVLRGASKMAIGGARDCEISYISR